MRIAHVSDIHIRNLKYREEYSAAFEDLYRQLEELHPDLVINTGDTVHSKLAVSPELFDDVACHLFRVAEIAPYRIILGNHDLNLKNKSRMNAISPIVGALRGSTRNQLELLSLPKMTLPGFPDFVFWNYDIRSEEHDFDVDPEKINVGLYHGSISGCVTDIGYTMEEGESEVSRFDAMDYVLMGDIHKRQSFRDGRMQYAGSLIQQNYGESREKGFLLWDIRSKTEFSVQFFPVVAPRRFYTINVGSDLKIPDWIDVPEDSRLRVLIEGDPPPSQKLELEGRIRERFSPAEIISVSEERAAAPLQISDIGLKRTELMREYLQEKELLGPTVDQIVELAERLLNEEEGDDLPRGTTWKLHHIEWDGMFNYGDGNKIDLDRLLGLVGIFAPNSSGKSSVFDILLQGFYDKISKDVPKNIDLINDNMELGRIGVEFSTNGSRYSLERRIERIKYGQRKADIKQWGRTSLDLARGEVSLNGTTRPETERALQRLVGSFEDFALTTMVSQNPIFGLPGGGDIINCKETDRRKILFRFLGLDVYEKVAARVKDELKQIRAGMRGDRTRLGSALSEAEAAVLKNESSVADLSSKLAGLDRELREARESLSRMGESRVTKLDLAVCSGELLHEKKGLARLLESQRECQDALHRLRQDRPKATEANLSDLAERIREARSRKDRHLQELSTAEGRVEAGKRALKVVETVPCEGKFPTCRFISDAAQFELIREELESATRQLGIVLQGDRDEVVRLEGIRIMADALVKWERDVSAMELKISQIETALAKAHAGVVRLTEEEDRIRQELERDPTSDEASALREKELTLTASAQASTEAMALAQRELGASSARRDALCDEIKVYDEMASRVELHEHLSDMIGKNGLPYRILSRVLPVLNAEIARVLAGIVKFTVFFEDDPEQQAVALRIRYGDYKSRPLSLGGGAEKFISALAIRVALLTVSSLPKTDILIIDEGFGKLDPENLEAVNRVFERLRDSFGTVFIISHVDSMRDIVDHSIDIVSRDGYAHISAP